MTRSADNGGQLFQGQKAREVASGAIAVFCAASDLDTHPVLCQSSRMDKSSILQALRAHESELKAAGIVHLRLFGSVARGESSSSSDVDLMAELDRSKHLTLLNLVRLENRLTDILGVKADLALADTMKEPVRLRASREAILAF
jgi:uncharacterized protein